MSTQELFHLFLLCLSCFEVLFCEYIEKGSLSNLASIEEEAFVSESPNFLEESFTRRLKEAPQGSTYLNEAPQGSAYLNEAPQGSAYLNKAPQGSAYLNKAPQGSAYLNKAPQGSAYLNKAPQGSAYLNKAPQGSAYLNKAPQGSAYLNKAPQGRAYLNEAPQGRAYLNRKRKPKRDNTEYLFSLMGDDFKPNFMTEKRPKKPWKPVPLSEVSLNVSEKILAKQKRLTLFENVSFAKEFARLQPDLLPYENEIKSWLTERASCPVAFRWKSLGPTYWPPWFRYGYCVDRKEKCSLPFGMSCVPAEEIDLYFLRWKCPKFIINRKVVANSGTFVSYANRKKEHKIDYASIKRTRCQWEKVPLPIIVACRCSC